VEYIVYDAAGCMRRGGTEADLPVIGPHVDNASCVSLIAMLCDRSDFTG